MAKKQSRKEFMKSLKAPDTYQQSFSRVLAWLNNNTIMIWAAVIPIFLVMIGIFTWQWYAEKQEWKLVESLGEIRSVYQDEGKSAEEKRAKISDQIAELNKKVTAIETPAKTDKPADGKTPAKKLSKTENDQIAELKAEIATLEKSQSDIKADHKDSLQQFEDFFSKHADTPQGWMAAFKAVSIRLETKDKASAKKLLADLLAKSGKSDFYQVQARFVYVNLLKDAGETDAALAELKTLEGKVDKKLKPLVLLDKAKVLVLKGEKENADKVLSEIMNDYANTPEADQAKNFKLIVKGS